MNRRPSIHAGRSRGYAATAAVLLISLLAACSPSTSSGNATAEDANAELLPIRIAIGTANTPQLLGIDEGIFEKHGLDVEVVEASGVEVITGDSADVAYSDLFNVLAGIDQGFDFTVVEGQNGVSFRAPVLVAQDSDIVDPADLAGRTIAIGTAPFARVFALLFLKAHGIDPDSVEFVLLATGAPEAVVSKRVDALLIVGGGAVGGATYLTTKNQYDLRVVGSEGDGPALIDSDGTQAGWFSRSEWYESNPETALRFAKAVRESNQLWASKTPDELADVFLKYNDYDLRALEADNPGLIEIAAEGNNVINTGPINVEATQEWISIGHELAPDAVPDLQIADYLSEYSTSEF